MVDNEYSLNPIGPRSMSPTGPRSMSPNSANREWDPIIIGPEVFIIHS